MAFEVPLWEDKIEDGFLKNNGSYILYRHRWENVEFDKPKGTVVIHFPSDALKVKDKEPIAWGFIAFLYVGLPGYPSYYKFLVENGTALNVDFYTQYFDFSKSWSARVFPSEPFLLDPVTFEAEFLLNHIEEESEHLAESEKFFTDTLNESDRVIKSKMKDKAFGYISFLQAKIDTLNNESTDSPDQFKNSTAINGDKHSTSHIKKKPQTLREIWKKRPEHYSYIISLLCKNPYVQLDIPFVTELDGVLTWNSSVQNTKSYLSGFIYTCLLNKWILDEYTAPDYVRIIKNTFNISVDSTSYKSPLSKAHMHKNDVYLIPFKTAAYLAEI